MMGAGATERMERMDEQRKLLRHFLAALAYRTQKALRDAAPEFAEFRAAARVRTPRELIRHMDGVLGYARTYMTGGNTVLPICRSLQMRLRIFTKWSKTSRITLKLARRCMASLPR